MDTTALQSSSGSPNHSVFESDFRTKILALYGAQLRRLCIDDSFTDLHARTLLIATQLQNSRLKRLDIILSASIFNELRLTEEGTTSLFTTVDTTLPQDCWLHFECQFSVARWLTRMPWAIYRADSCRLDIKDLADIKELASAITPNVQRRSATESMHVHLMQSIHFDRGQGAVMTFPSSGTGSSRKVKNPAAGSRHGPQSFQLQHLSLKVTDANLVTGGIDVVAQVIAQSPKLTRFDIRVQTIQIEDLRMVVDALDFSTLKELIFSIAEWSTNVRMGAYRALAEAIPVGTSGGREGDGKERVGGRAIALSELRLRDAWGNSTAGTRIYISEEMAKVPWCKVIFE